MDFREFVLLYENRLYFAYLDRQGQYHVNSGVFRTPVERNRGAEIVQNEEKPVKMWYFTIKPGDARMSIPGATPEEENQIGLAYYRRMGFDEPFRDEPEEEVEGDIMDPKSLDPNYWKKVAAKRRAMSAPFKASAGGTLAFRPQAPPPSGATTPYPPPS